MADEIGQNDHGKVELPVTMEWLEWVVNAKIGSKARLIEAKCSIIGEGKGFLSVITKAQLRWDKEPKDETLPSSLIIKRPTLDRIASLDPGGVLADLVEEEVLREYHNRECDVYDLLTKYEDASPIPIATCYYIEKRNDNERGMLILEDMSKVAKSLHFNDYLNEKQAMTLAEHIGSLQAYGFRHPNAAKRLTPLSKDPYLSMLDSVKDSVKAIREKHSGMLKYRDDQIDQFTAECLEDMKMFRDMDSKAFTPVIALGDVQPNNIMWKINEDGSLSNEVAAFIDFQICQLSNCVADIGISMVSGMTTTARRNVTDDLLQRVAKVIQEKSHNRGSVSLSEVKRMYKKVLLKSALICLQFVTMITKMPESAGIEPGKDVDLLKRCNDAIGDAISM